MARPKRVLSFMSQWAHGPVTLDSNNTARSSPSSSPEPDGHGGVAKLAQSRTSELSPKTTNESSRESTFHGPAELTGFDSQDSQGASASRASATPRRANTPDQNRRLSYTPPVMEMSRETPAELQPIFQHLNNHQNKLYQEGYFLKLHDLDSRGRPSADRVWTECFAQLVGTILSLWDAAALDAAGEDGEVIPTFINLTDASIKMIESLPMNGVDGQSLQNVLSISTAANNRYLLHFNSLHSLTQWTAGIRLAMYEYAVLQEAYTGSILAGKGKHLNNIRVIMERSRFPVEDWTRVRFGAGTPWRRLWCVITPPDEKEYAKAQKNMKKKSAYDRSVPALKGSIKFYENRKVTKKSMPIATIIDAYSAYAVYPQNKSLIDASTLIKVEGTIRIHTKPESTTEGFLFVMPEVHPAITGFEMMLRWLLPCFDTFGLYGRPNRLIADVIDTRSIMFGMPAGRRYGYLELIDVAGLIHTDGSQKWAEREWRKQIKALTAKRMSAPTNPSRSNTDLSMRSRASFNLPSGGNSQRAIKFGGDNTSVAAANSAMSSAPGSRQASPPRSGFEPPQRVSTAPSANGMLNPGTPHKRAVSDQPPASAQRHPRLSFEQSEDGDERDRQSAPAPPPHSSMSQSSMSGSLRAGPPERRSEEYVSADEGTNASGAESDLERGGGGSPYHGSFSPRTSSHSHTYQGQPLRVETFQPHSDQPGPVAAPPTMAHSGGQRPAVQPNQHVDLRRANSTIDDATLAQIREAKRVQKQPPHQGPGPSQGPPPPAHGKPFSPPNMAQQQQQQQQQQMPPQLAGMGKLNLGFDAGAGMSQGPYPPPHSPTSGAYSPSANPYTSHSPYASPTYGSPYGSPQYGPPPVFSLQGDPYASSSSPGGYGSPRRGPEPQRLPTIPGTPATEPDRFNLPRMNSSQSVTSVRRKPVPSPSQSGVNIPLGGGGGGGANGGAAQQ